MPADRIVTVDSSHFGSGSGLTYDFYCTGSESNVLECGHVPVSDASNCTHKSDVGVICRGTLIFTEFCEKVSNVVLA